MAKVSSRCLHYFLAVILVDHTAKHFDEYLKFGKTQSPKTWRSVFFVNLLKHYKFLTTSIEQFSIYFFVS